MWHHFPTLSCSYWQCCAHIPLLCQPLCWNHQILSKEPKMIVPKLVDIGICKLLVWKPSCLVHSFHLPITVMLSSQETSFILLFAPFNAALSLSDISPSVRPCLSCLCIWWPDVWEGLYLEDTWGCQNLLFDWTVLDFLCSCCCLFVLFGFNVCFL